MQTPKFSELLPAIFKNRAPDIIYPPDAPVARNEIVVGQIDDPIAQSLWSFSEHMDKLLKDLVLEHHQHHRDDCDGTDAKCLSVIWQAKRLTRQSSILKFLFWSYVIEKFPETYCPKAIRGLRANWQIIATKRGKPIFRGNSQARKFFGTVAQMIGGESNLPVTRQPLERVSEDEEILGILDSRPAQLIYGLGENLCHDCFAEFGFPHWQDSQEFDDWFGAKTVAEIEIIALKIGRIKAQSDHLAQIFWELVYDLVPKTNSVEIEKVGVREGWRIVSIPSERTDEANQVAIELPPELIQLLRRLLEE